MIARVLLFAFFFIIAIGITEGANSPAQPQNGAFDIILLMGQSNATSRGLGAAPSGSDGGIWQFGRNSFDYQIVPAKEPLMNVTHVTHGTGFALQFARYYRDNFLQPGRAVLIVPTAKGATSVARPDAYWRPGRAGNKDVRDRMSFVKREFPNANLVAILWHQGESDWRSDQFTYRARTGALLKSVRNEFDPSGEAPIILGELAEVFGKTALALPVSDSIRDLAQTIPRAGLALATGLRTHGEVSPDSNSDLIHFSAKSQLELAARYFCAYARLAHPHGSLAQLPYCERFSTVHASIRQESADRPDRISCGQGQSSCGSRTQ